VYINNGIAALLIPRPLPRSLQLGFPGVTKHARKLEKNREQEMVIAEQAGLYPTVFLDWPYHRVLKFRSRRVHERTAQRYFRQRSEDFIFLY
jgi:hypothetical protein